VTLSRRRVPEFLVEAYRCAEAGHPDQAAARLGPANLDQILRMDPAAPEAASCWILLGKIWRQAGRLKEAAEAYEQAVRLRSEPAIGAELARIYLEVGRPSEALACCLQALTHAEEEPELRGLYATCLIQIGRIREGIGILRELIAGGRASCLQHSQYLWFLSYLPEIQAQDLFAACVHWGQSHARPVSPGRTYTNDPDPDRRIRVGYLSADFRHHSVAYTFESLLDARDPRAIEMVGYGNVAAPDEVTERMRAKFDRYRDIRHLDDRQVAACIEQDGIDVLIAMGGHTRGHRLGVLASSPAPVQVDHGSVTTVGMEQIQYRLTDTVLDPPQSRRHYLEELVYLPGGLVCYRPEDGMPPVKALPARQNGCVTFGSFAHHLKIHAGVIALWAAILRQVPGSRLLIKCAGGHDLQLKADLERQFQACGVESRRIRVLGWVPKPGHWDLYNQVDIALDTHPFNGCLTTLEALWMGVPTVTLTGETYVSRVGSDILGRAGMGPCVASTADQMVAKAVALAGDRDTLARIRVGLRPRMKASPLCDTRRFARQMEAAYRQMWRQWCNSKTQDSELRTQSAGSRGLNHA
jgi:predicted O-linked N-acetylglucosamine transferase (SPINDLY family)